MSVTSRSFRLGIAGVALATAVPLGLAAPAHASGGNDGRVIRTGNCSKTTDWKLKAKHDDGRIEVEGEIDSNRSGQLWSWAIRHNGSVSARGQKATAGRSGSFSVERKLVNLRGVDTFWFIARNPRTGEVCNGVVRI